ncbi:Fungal-specific transcription factor domain containing protein [Ceratobasidium theobromae]|uniref:Fungal-specific transcription factor domain containing protein n=1 Tax=Ceratobasidium theobromae TaxID=1582974 RepID=A0A5N5QGS8_9AGAM|nr:Fungal-specific transcription factor domain containing protein [Ceratobasidium theobromae]
MPRPKRVHGGPSTGQYGSSTQVPVDRLLEVEDKEPHTQAPTLDHGLNNSPNSIDSLFSLTGSVLRDSFTDNVLAWCDAEIPLPAETRFLEESYPAYSSLSSTASSSVSPPSTEPDIEYPSPPHQSLPSYSHPPQAMTDEQARLFQALFSLGDPTNKIISAIPTSLSTVPSPWSGDLELANDDDEDDEGVKQVIYGTLMLSADAEGNELPFVLESYAMWVNQTAFEPRKAAHGARELIVNQFNDSESRWTITTLANIVRALSTGAMWDGGQSSSYYSKISALQDHVVQQVATADRVMGSMGQGDLCHALKAMGNIMEASEAQDNERTHLMQTAAPLFRRLCSDLPDKPIHLQSLLLQPILSLRHYAIVDIFSSISAGRAMFFRYDTSYDPSLDPSAIFFQGDVGLQWLHGIPGQIVIVFARINAMREQGTQDPRALAELEGIVKNLVPIPSVSSDSFLTVARLMVQECWRQVALIFLYMGLFGVNADDPRVKRAFSRFMKLLNGVKPGHTPDSFLVLNFVIAGVAARQDADRNVIRRRLLNNERFRYRYPGAKEGTTMLLLECVWLRADRDGRPAVWGDLETVISKSD